MAVYYLSPTGNDTTGTGSISAPWFTLEKAWDNIVAGDIVYMRGGTYNYLKTQWLTGVTGTSDNIISLLNYPGEVPIIQPATGWVYDGWYYGILFQSMNYIHVKGLEVRNFKYQQTSPCRGIMAQHVNYCLFENLSCHHNEIGMMLTGNSGGNLILNCDFYENHDPYSSPAYNNGDGLDVSSIPNSYSNIIRGCRAWWNADDGFDLWASEGVVVVDNCWAWSNGYQEDHVTHNEPPMIGNDGNGFKLGQVTETTATTRRYVYNCIGALNRINNFSHNVVDPQVLTCEVYNCFSYGAVEGDGYQFNWGAQAATNSILRNNVSYNDANAALVDTWVTHDHNSWNAGYTVTAADFVSLDTSELFLPRRPDGSLPIINFGRLVSGSDLINTGVDVGLAYKGTYPDLGPFEYLTTYYIKSTGSDSNDGGSDDTAWQTITKVNTEWAAGTFAPGDNILFKRGDTFYGTITITGSGVSGSPITIGAYGTGNKPIITGFTTLTGWELHSGSIYKTTITETQAQTNSVIVNNIFTGMGRYPDAGTWRSYTTGGTATLYDATLPDSPNWTGAEVVINKEYWITDRCTITDHSSGTLTYTGGKYNNTSPNRRYFIQNDLRTVTTTNEWYHDFSGNVFYIYGDPSEKEVKVATLNYLLYNNGHDYINIDNINFSGSISHAIYYNGSTNYCTIENCTITFAGGSAMELYGGDYLEINYNIISNSNYGIYCTGDNNNIRYNNISYIGMIIGAPFMPHATGIYISQTNNIIEYNDIQYISWSGINTSSVATYTIRYNFINYALQNIDDGGGIYSTSSTGTRLIDRNIVLNSGVGGEPWLIIPRGIYYDAGGSGAIITNNIVAGCLGAGLLIHYGDNHTITGNLLYNNQRQAEFLKFGTGVSTGITFNNNRLIAREASQLTLRSNSYTNAEIQAWGTFNNNYYARPIDDDNHFYYGSANHTLSDWKVLVTPNDINSYGSPTSVSSTDDIHFIYNETSNTKQYLLSTTMVDVTNASYSNIIDLLPYTGLVLLGSGTVTEYGEGSINDISILTINKFIII